MPTEPESDAGGIGKQFFNHVGLCVTDRNRARAFYERALGSRTPTTSRFLEHGGEVLEDTLIPGVVVMIRDPDGQSLELIERKD